MAGTNWRVTVEVLDDEDERVVWATTELGVELPPVAIVGYTDRLHAIGERAALELFKLAEEIKQQEPT